MCPSLVIPSIRITNSLLPMEMLVNFELVPLLFRTGRFARKTRGTSLSRTIIEKSRDCLTFEFREDMWSRDTRRFLPRSLIKLTASRNVHRVQEIYLTTVIQYCLIARESSNGFLTNKQTLKIDRLLSRSTHPSIPARITRVDLTLARKHARNGRSPCNEPLIVETILSSSSDNRDGTGFSLHGKRGEESRHD